MIDKYKSEHFDRLIEATSDLYKQPDSICMKCHYTEGSICCMCCYCPLYDQKDCGGNYSMLPNGIKDCSQCFKPHTKEFVKRYLEGLYG